MLVGDIVTLPFRSNGLILYWVALIAYAVAGNRAASASTGSVRRAGRDGALAAMAAYIFIIPLQFAARHQGITVLNTAIALLAAMIVGGLAAIIVARARQTRTAR